MALAGLSASGPLVNKVEVQVGVTPTTAAVQVVLTVGMTPASEAEMPPGVAISVSGVSAYTESEPHPKGIV